MGTWQKQLPRLSPDDMRRVSISFPASTSASLGNFHPRHTALLNNEGLEVLSSIWEASEPLGVLPWQLRRVLMSLLGKPSGGDRLIISHAGMYGIWQRA